MNNHKHRYSINKIKYKFRTPIFQLLNTPIEDPEEPDVVMMNSDNEIQEPVCSDDYRELLGTFTKLRKNAKRKLEVLIRKHRNTINSLEREERDGLLSFISEKFYNLQL